MSVEGLLTLDVVPQVGANDDAADDKSFYFDFTNDNKTSDVAAATDDNATSLFRYDRHQSPTLRYVFDLCFCSFNRLRASVLRCVAT